METAKVDIRKLQLLNDRINQCIDALTQVRLSVHGLSHTSAVNPNAQLGAFGTQTQQGGFQPPPQTGFPQSFPQVGFPQAQGGFTQSFGGGLSHSVPQAGSNPFVGMGGIPVGIGGVPGVPMGVNPYAAWGGAQGAWAPYASQLGQLGGLSHSGPEGLEGYSRPAWSDPLLAVKVAQTFPYAQFAVPPVVTLY